MTANSESSVAAAQTPEGIFLRRADLGGWVLEIIVNGVRKTGAYGSDKAAIEAAALFMSGTVKKRGGRKPKVDAVPGSTEVVERKKPGPKKGWKKETPVGEGQSNVVAEAA